METDAAYVFINSLDLILQQANHRFTTTLQRRIYGRATDVAIRPLNEEKAVQAAADLVGEFFVFTVSQNILTGIRQSNRSRACLCILYISVYFIHKLIIPSLILVRIRLQALL